MRVEGSGEVREFHLTEMKPTHGSSTACDVFTYDGCPLNHKDSGGFAQTMMQKTRWDAYRMSQQMRKSVGTVHHGLEMVTELYSARVDSSWRPAMALVLGVNIRLDSCRCHQKSLPMIPAKIVTDSEAT